MEDFDENEAVTTFHELNAAIDREDRGASEAALDRLSQMGFDEDRITLGLKGLRDNQGSIGDEIEGADQAGPGLWDRVKDTASSVVKTIGGANLDAEAQVAKPELPPAKDLVPSSSTLLGSATRPVATLAEGAILSGPQKTLRKMRDIAQSLQGEDSIPPGESYSGVAKLLDKARRYVEGADTWENPEGERTPIVEPGTAVERIAGGVGEGLTGDLPLLVAATTAAGPAGFGLMTALEERAGGGSRGQVLEQGVKGAVMGQAMHEANVLKPLARGGVIGTGSAATSLLEGADPEQALESGITMGVLAAQGGPGEKTLREAGREMATEGKRIAVDLGVDVKEKAKAAKGAAGPIFAAAKEKAAAAGDAVGGGLRAAVDLAGATAREARVRAAAVVKRARERAEMRGRTEPTREDVAEAASDVRRADPVAQSLMDGRVMELPTGEIGRSPERFQYKGDVNEQGVTREYDDAERYNPDLGGIIDVWRDPEDGKVYVVNGHHRHYMAERDGVPTMLVKFMDAKTAEEARATGALMNIADKKGTAVDAAKMIRDGGLTPEAMKRYGIATEGAIARDGIGLARLDQGIFTMVAMGDLSVRRGAAIGRELPEPTDQRAVVKMIRDREAAGKDVSDRTVDELIRLTKGAARGAESEGEQTGWDAMLGEKSTSSSTILEKADLTGRILEALNKDKRLFGFVAEGKRASRIAEAGGGNIEVDRAKEVAERAARASAIFKLLSTQVGPVSEALNQGALRVRNGENPTKVAREVYDAIRPDIESALPGGATENLGSGVVRGAESEGQGGFFRRPGEPAPGGDGRGGPEDAAAPNQELTPREMIRQAIRQAPTDEIREALKNREEAYGRYGELGVPQTETLELLREEYAKRVREETAEQGRSEVPPPAEAAEEIPEEFILEREREAFYADDGQIRDSIAVLRERIGSGEADRAGVRDLYDETLRIYEAERQKRADRVGKLGGVDAKDEPPGPYTGARDTDPATEAELRETLARAPGAPEGVEEPSGTPKFVKEPTGDEPPDQLPLLGTGWRSIFRVAAPRNRAQVRELVKRSEILREVMKRLDVVHRVGRIKMRGALGLFKLRPRVIRTKLLKDMVTAFHEIGHAIDQRAFSNAPDDPDAVQIRADTFAAFRDELAPIATWAPEGYELPEGFAEFVAHYVTNEVAAARMAPRFYQFFEQTLDERAPEIKETLLWARERLEAYEAQDAFAKIASNISSGESPAVRGGRFDDFYKNWFYDRVALDKYRNLIADPRVRDSMFKVIAENAIKGPRSQFDDLPALDDPALLARLLPAWLPRAETWIRPGMSGQIDFATQRTIGRPFETIVKPIKDHERFGIYLVANRVLEVHEADLRRKARDPKYKMRETSIDLDNAREVVRQYEAEQPGAREIQRQVHELQMNLLRYFADSGMLSQDNYRYIERALKNYVPLYRLLEDDVEAGFKRTLSHGTNPGVVDLHLPVYRFHGSDRDIINPYESILKNIHTLVYIAERNQVGQALVKLSRKAKGKGGELVEEIPEDRVAAVQLSPAEIEKIILDHTQRQVSVEVSESIERLAETVESSSSGPGGAATGGDRAQRLVEERVLEALRARGFSSGEAQQMVERIKNAPSAEVRTERIRETLNSVRLVEIREEMQMVLPDKAVPIFRPDIVRNGEPIVAVYFDGKPTYLRLSPEMYAALKGLDKETARVVTNLFAPAARIVRAGVVLSPEFGPFNFVRDQIEAFVKSKYGFIPYYDAVWGLAQHIDHFMKSRKDPTGTAGNKWVKGFYMSGAPMADMMAFDRQYLQHGVAEVMRNVGAMVQAPDHATRLERFRIMVENGLVKAGAPPHGLWLVTHPIEAVRLFNELSDNATRLALYKRAYVAEEKKARAAGDPLSHRELQARAGIEGRDGSLDFARAGLKSRVVNQIIPFWNIKPQGLDGLARAFKHDPRGFALRALIGVTIPSLLSWLASSGDPRYDDQPDYIRDLYYVLPTGTVSRDEWLAMSPEQQRAYNDEHPIVIWPKSHELGLLFGSSIERALDYWTDKDPEAMARWSKSLIASMMPGIVPALLGPSLENALNYSFFRGSNIVPRDLMDVEAQLQETGSTSETAKRIASYTNVIPMPEFAGKGLGLQSPIKIENLIRGHLGGMSRLAIDVTDYMLGRQEGTGEAPDEPLLNSMWIIRRFFRRYPVTQVRPVEGFYKQYQASMEAKKTLDELIDRGDRLGIESLKVRRGFDLKVHDMMKSAGQAFTAYRGKIDRIRDDKELDGKTKRMQMDEWTLRMISQARKVFEHVEELRAEEANEVKGKIKFPNALGIDEGGTLPTPTPAPAPKKQRPVDVSQAMRRGQISSADIPRIARERRAAD